jgi:NAD(P) transhydrogenase subunit beta
LIHTSSSLQLVETYIGIFIGAITFSGSVVAFLKLDAKVDSKAFMLFGKKYGKLRHLLNFVLLVACLGLTIPFIYSPSLIYLYVMTVLSLFLGWHLVISIGGADMPVVISMLVRDKIFYK